ncbi:ATP-binding cassette domain-containing protein [Aurantibacillus circumpalustris]|uniref:ATP-binding cassette domain-containing protein n=1 Tax=Aurantibacillus circumpalustris TaxID=3036359 RepID=UPI00295A7BE0|nr:ATP-binding cassette domain-containing protein [Aurantibacillus circumpalustris]
MITTKIVSFKYKESVVLENIDLSFESGKTHGIVGLNGAGKTTYFNLMAGFIKDEGCSFTRDGKLIQRKDIAFIDTDLFFYPKLTAKEFLSVFPNTNTTYHEEKLADLFKLPLNGFMEEFSTGMKKKLLLQSQIKQNKEIYILDEPFNGLDLETNKILEVIIAILNERGKTVFISSHILEPLLEICSQIHYLKNKTVFKSYKKHEFNLIEEELFGNYAREMKNKLLKII